MFDQCTFLTKSFFVKISIFETKSLENFNLKKKEYEKNGQ